MNWTDVINVVAAALAAHRFPAEGDSPGSPSLLAALTGSAPPSLQRRLQRDHAAQGDVEPLIYQNELPVRLLAHGIIGIAAHAVASRPGASEPGAGDPRVMAIVALAALSTLRLDRADHTAPWTQDRLAGLGFDEIAWTQALDSLADRTAELDDLLRRAASDRRQTWRQVSLEDRILAEAVAAAVVGGAALANGLPARQWTFPFHLFCSLAVSAAKLSLRTIERWLGIEFLPAPLAPERTASLAVLVADEASALEQGCGCKADTGVDEIAYARRGPCRQADHDLRAWLPGQPKPGSRTGARYASTLWGWQRRWLGGANAGRAATDGHPERPRLHSNDVASSVLARRWLSGDRGFGGPVLLYDRILPEFCLTCGSKVQLAASTDGAGRTIIRRMPCCGQQQLVYRSEFTFRGGRGILKPKLGIIVAWPSSSEGNAGYGTTALLGPLWICRRSGRYSLSARHCPSAECRADGKCSLGPVPHGWVLLPLSDAWADLKATGGLGDYETASLPPDGTVSEAELRLIAGICGKLWPDRECRFETPADVWTLASSWSSAQMNDFMALGKRPGLELLLRCKEIAQAQAGGDEYGHGALNYRSEAARNYDQGDSGGEGAQ